MTVAPLRRRSSPAPVPSLWFRAGPTVVIVLALMLCLVWGIYILAGLGLGGYGRGARTELLVAAVVPPALASILLIGAGTVRLRRHGAVGRGTAGAVLAIAALIIGVGVGALAFILYQAGT